MKKKIKKKSIIHFFPHFSNKNHLCDKIPAKRNREFCRVPHTLGRLSNNDVLLKINLYLSRSLTILNKKWDIFIICYDPECVCVCVCVPENILTTNGADYRYNYAAITPEKSIQ